MKQEKGFSLIEVVTSIVIITIIFISFFSFFIQSKKVNVSSASIQDATYVAQDTMEELYLLASTINARTTLSSNGYVLTQSYPLCNDSLPLEQSETKETYVYTNQRNDFEITRTLSFLCSANHVSKIAIEVTSTRDSTQKATLENIYIWK